MINKNDNKKKIMAHNAKLSVALFEKEKTARGYQKES